MRLSKHCSVAEIRRGCVWAQRFGLAEDVAESGGSLIGSSQFLGPRRGIRCSPGYPRYNIPPDLFGRLSSLSIVMDFSPSVGVDGGGSYCYYFELSVVPGTSLATNYFNQQSNTWIVGKFGGGALLNYSTGLVPYWRQNQRNLLVWSTTSGSNSLYFNGAYASTIGGAWSPSTGLSCITIAARGNGTSIFPGIFYSFKIFNRKLTQQEAYNYYDQIARAGA